MAFQNQSTDFLTIQTASKYVNMAHSDRLYNFKMVFIVGSSEEFTYFFTNHLIYIRNTMYTTFTSLIRFIIPIELSGIVSGRKNKTYLLPMIRLFLKKFMLENA